jgi:hypothetical protein
MGQQQLLLIILGVIIVGIAIAVGLSLFSGNSEESNKDAIISDLTNLAADAYQFYLKPTNLAGGGHNYTSYVIPSRLSSNDNGTYVATGTQNSITIVGTSTTVSGGSITITVDTEGKVTDPAIVGW